MSTQRLTRKPRGFGPAARRRVAAVAAVLLALAASLKAHAGDGGLELLRDGQWSDALRLDAEVEMRIYGPIAEVVLRQRYVNDGEGWLEGRYLLPLPPDAAVGRLRVAIGQRLIEGEVREKAAARAAYQAAARSGRAAALVEQDRPHLFRTGLANIGPGETVEVEIGYWQAARFADGEFSLTLPLTLTPAYTPVASLDPPPQGLPAAARAAPHSLEPTVSFAIELHAGLPLSAVHSPTHRLRVQPMAGFQRIELADWVEAANRDFELRWRPLPSTLPQRALFAEERDGEVYALLMLIPPTLPVPALPRELIGVIDTSGSMQGGALLQAVAAIDAALARLRPADRFNLIQFNQRSDRLFPEPVPASPEWVAKARRWLATLRADGGTEMAPALRLAFEGTPPGGHLRQVVLATDAAIGNERELFALIEAEAGVARLFPVGIGSAPNGHFIRKAAQLGRGSQTVIRDLKEVASGMDSLFARLDRPLLQDLELHWPQALETYPERLPDLYHGEPLFAVAKLAALEGELDLRGQSAGTPWRSKARLDPLHVVTAPGVGRLWARSRIEALEDAGRNGLAEEQVRTGIVETALQHGLASRYTSLVAVERTPARPQDAELASTAIANAAPADTLALAQGSTPARSRLGLAAALALIAGALLRRRERPLSAGMA